MRPPIQDKFFLESILSIILNEMKNLGSFSESHSAETKSEASREACPEQSRRAQYDSAVQDADCEIALTASQSISVLDAS